MPENERCLDDTRVGCVLAISQNTSRVSCCESTLSASKMAVSKSLGHCGTQMDLTEGTQSSSAWQNCSTEQLPKKSYFLYMFPAYRNLGCFPGT